MYTKDKAALKKIGKYCLFGVLYCFLLFEVTFTSGVFDFRSLFWPSTPGQVNYVITGGRFFACYGYQYQVRDKIMQGSQILPLAYKDNLKQLQIIRVHYDNNNPEKSFLVPEFNPIVMFTVLFVNLLGVFLLFIPISSWVSAHQKEKL